METTRNHHLSALLSGKVAPNAADGKESTADAHLLECNYTKALEAYNALDIAQVRIATKAAYCEWMLGQEDEALSRLSPRLAELEADGIGLLSWLVWDIHDSDKRHAETAIVWPYLRDVISRDSVPRIAAVARAMRWWPQDDYEQRYCDLERLLSMHPDAQVLRLAYLTEMQRKGISPREQLDLLHQDESEHKIPRYRWTQAIAAYLAGEYDEAQSLLTGIEHLEHQVEEPSQYLLATISLARLEIAAAQGETQALSDFEKLASDDSISSEERLRVAHVALAAACQRQPHQVSAFAAQYFTALRAHDPTLDIATGRLHAESDPVSGSAWERYGDPWPFRSLIPWKTLLTNVSGETERLYFRAAFVADEISQLDDDGRPSDWWESLARELGSTDSNEAEFGGSLLSLQTLTSAHSPRPNWTNIGKTWITAEWLQRKNGHEYTHGWLTLDAANRTKTSLRNFSKGVERQMISSPIDPEIAFDLLEGLIGALEEKECYPELYKLLRTLSESDSRTPVQFKLGLYAQRSGYDDEAKVAYIRVLDQTPTDFATLFNSLLLCKSHVDGTFLARIEELVTEFPDAKNDEEQRRRLSEQLSKARERCRNLEAEKKDVVIAELAKQKPLTNTAVSPTEISLRAAVTLLALFRCAKAEPWDEQLPPFDQATTAFSPAYSCQQGIFDLLDAGLIAVSPVTKISAFEVRDGIVSGWHLGRIVWRVSPVVSDLVESLRSLNGHIPDSWRQDVGPLAYELARGEITEYIHHLSDERGLPPPENTEEVSDLVRALVNDLSVSQAFYAAYLGAMSASDYKLKYRVSGQKAADMLVKRTGQRLESLREGRLTAKNYDRPWKLGRSAVSYALWGTILDRGDSGFSHRISDVLGSI